MPAASQEFLSELYQHFYTLEGVLQQHRLRASITFGMASITFGNIQSPMRLSFTLSAHTPLVQLLSTMLVQVGVQD